MSVFRRHPQANHSWKPRFTMKARPDVVGIEVEGEIGNATQMESGSYEPRGGTCRYCRLG